MTRIGPQTVIQRQGDVLVLSDARSGQELVLQVAEGARLAIALPYLLDGSTGVQSVAAERVRQLTQYTRSQDLQGGAQHLANLLTAAAGYTHLAAAQAEQLERPDATQNLAQAIVAGQVTAPALWPRDFVWRPDVDPHRNAVRAGALVTAALDVLSTIRAMGEAARP